MTVVGAGLRQDGAVSACPRVPYSRLAEGPDGDSLLTAEDFEVAFSSVRRGSAPGHDGLPYEFYRHYHKILTPVLLRVFNSAFRNTTTPCPLALRFTPARPSFLCSADRPDHGPGLQCDQ